MLKELLNDILDAWNGLNYQPKQPPVSPPDCPLYSYNPRTGFAYCRAILDRTGSYAEGRENLNCPTDRPYNYCNNCIMAEQGAPCKTYGCGGWLNEKEAFYYQNTSAAFRCKKCRKRLSEILAEEEAKLLEQQEADFFG